MKRELIIINVVLVLTLIGAVFKLRSGWLDFEATHSVSLIQFVGDPLGVPDAPPDESTLVQDWTAIGDQNLFSFDRNDLDIEIPTGPATAGPRPFLFGTMSLGSEPMAMLATGKVGNRSYRPMKVGEVIDGWELREILEKSVRVRSGGFEVAVVMNDPTVNAPRVANRTIPRGRAAPQVSTVQIPQQSRPRQPAMNRSPRTPAGIPNPDVVTEENVPQGFMIQRTPFGNRLVPKPQP